MPQAEPLDTETALMRAHRRRQAEARKETAERARPKTPAPERFCGAREPDTMRVCTLAPGHEGDHDSGIRTWHPSGAPRSAREFTNGLGERLVLNEATNSYERVDHRHAEKLEHVYSLIVASPGKDALELARPHRGALKELEKAGRIEWRDGGWYPTAPAPSSKTETTRTMEAIDQIELDRIEPDPAQPRKHFDEAKLEELAASITKHGVQQPIRVRPVAGRHGHYMIIFGERRWRASKLAGLDTIPAIVDTEAGDDPAALLERQLIENAQREDIHPLEEGEALKELHERHGYSIEELMAKVGKSRSHVYSRIKLTELAPGVKKAMLDGRLPHAHGELIGRIPDHKLQEQCCKEVLGEVADKTLWELEDLGVRHEAVNPKEDRALFHHERKRQVLSFRATATLVRRRYQTRLSLATFDPADATLTAAGACGPCPHRSGNQPELPGVFAPGKGEDYCTNLACFEAKTQAQWKRVADAARAQGKKVIEGKKAAELFYSDGQLKADCGYALPTQQLPYSVIDTYDNKLTYKKLLGKHIAEVPTAIIQDGRGAAVEVLDAKKAIEILRERKLLPKKGATSSRPQTEAEKKAAAQRKKEREAEKLREEAYPHLIAQAVAAARALPDNKTAALWRMVALFLREYLDFAASELYRAIHGDEASKHVTARLEKLRSEADLRALVVELVLIQAGDDVTSASGLVDEAMELATKLLGIDWKKAEKDALAAREAKKKTEAAEKAAAAKKKGGAK